MTRKQLPDSIFVRRFIPKGKGKTPLSMVTIDGHSMRAKVVWTDAAGRVEITVGDPMHPTAKFYWDANPINLRPGDEILLKVERINYE